MTRLRLPAFALVVVALTALQASTCAHFKLLEPASWINSDQRGDPQKAGPCGGDPKGENDKLLTNAIDHNPEGCLIEVQLRRVSRQLAEISVRDYGVEATPTLIVNGKYRVAMNTERGIGPPEAVQIALYLFKAPNGPAVDDIEKIFMKSPQQDDDGQFFYGVLPAPSHSR